MLLGNTYVITSDSLQGEIRIKYNLNGFLVYLEITAQLSAEHYSRFFDEKKLYLEQNAIAMTKQPNSKVVVVPEDLSFERFWKTYNNPEGKKKMTENCWKRLSDRAKIAALVYIPIYDRKLAQSGIAKAYPSTYLNQEYWKNIK